MVVIDYAHVAEFIDIKIPSEHTVCGRQYDGEMQYYFFHPRKETYLVVAWLFEAKVENSINWLMQYLIDELQDIYDEDEVTCEQMLGESPLSDANIHRKKNKMGGGIWDPFDKDIQKTIHFWGYTGSLTEPPCSRDTLWRIMDVPVPITSDQLRQMQTILFNHRDRRTCEYTSTHCRGSVARPVTEKAARYYKCTRSDYKSKGEREWCGDDGCGEPFGKDLNAYVEPIIDVTSPPSGSPTKI